MSDSRSHFRSLFRRARALIRACVRVISIQRRRETVLFCGDFCDPTNTGVHYLKKKYKKMHCFSNFSFVLVFVLWNKNNARKQDVFIFLCENWKRSITKLKIFFHNL